MDSYDGSTIYGLVFFIEITIVYIISEKGEICLINGVKEIINKFKENLGVKIENLEYKGIDRRNYHIYYINNKSKIIDSTGLNNNNAIIKLILLDEINPNIDYKLKLNDSTYSIVDKIQFFPLIIKDESTYALQSFELSINNKKNIFKTFIYKGEINIIAFENFSFFIYNNINFSYFKK